MYDNTQMMQSLDVKFKSTKLCNSCKIEQEFHNFTFSKISQDSLGYRCRNCNTKKMAEWRRKNPLKSQLNSKRYREKNKEKNKILRKEWAAKNPEKIKFYQDNRVK